MGGSAAEEPVRAGALSCPQPGPLWWALLFGVLTTAGLGLLSWGLLVVHALGYGVVTVIAPDADVAAPDGGRHVLAFVVGVLVHLGIASASALLAPRTAIRRWPPVVQGLGAALVAATAAACGLLLTLGISPVGFFLGL